MTFLRACVRHFTTAPSKSAETLFIKNLSWGATRDDVGNYFAKFTDVKDVRLALDRLSGKHRGFGFVDIVHENVGEVVANANGGMLNGRPIMVSVSSIPKPAFRKNSEQVEQVNDAPKENPQ